MKNVLEQILAGLSNDPALVTDNYIYMVTKKDSNDFYIGRTDIHLIIDWIKNFDNLRFPVSYILQYKFELLERVPADHIKTREAYWINIKYKEAKGRCLNVQIPPFLAE